MGGKKKKLGQDNNQGWEKEKTQGLVKNRGENSSPVLIITKGLVFGSEEYYLFQQVAVLDRLAKQSQNCLSAPFSSYPDQTQI